MILLNYELTLHKRVDCYLKLDVVEKAPELKDRGSGEAFKAVL